MPEDILSEVQETMSEGAHFFAFSDDMNAQLIMGFLFTSPTRAEQAVYDAMLPKLNETFLMSISGELNYQPLSGLDGIGEVTYGTTSVIRTGALSMRYDTIGFRRGQVVAILILAYPDGDEPEMTISDLGALVDERTLEYLSNPE